LVEPKKTTTCGKKVQHTCTGTKPCQCTGWGQVTEDDCTFDVCSTDT
jgi:hypothetical protein